eukprot:297438-Pelagomonas_calceolata.AAC.2
MAASLLPVSCTMRLMESISTNTQPTCVSIGHAIVACFSMLSVPTKVQHPPTPCWRDASR